MAPGDKKHGEFLYPMTNHLLRFCDFNCSRTGAGI